MEDADGLMVKQFFNSAFPVIAALYQVPDYVQYQYTDPILAIAGSMPISVDTAVVYDTARHHEDLLMPQHPGSILRNTNSGVPILWDSVHSNVPGVVHSDLLQNQNPNLPLGMYTFNNIPKGKYVLELSRAGYVTRYAEITVAGKDSIFIEHRTLVLGDVNGDGVVDSLDILLIEQNQAPSFLLPNYDARYDVNADGKVNGADISAVKSFIGFSKRFYSDTRQWIIKYE
jgi:hypothetical protein